MKNVSAILLLAIFAAFSAGSALEEDALNSANTTSDDNVTTNQNDTTVATVTEPQETASRFKQLSNYTEGPSVILGKNIAPEYSDVVKTADKNTVFSREAGVPSPSVKVSITRVNTEDDKYVEVANQAVGDWDLTAWTLASAGETTFTFPATNLEMGKSIRIHEGNGTGSKTDIFANASTSLWIDNLVSLKDTKGNVISSFDVSTVPSKRQPIDPLARFIQY